MSGTASTSRPPVPSGESRATLWGWRLFLVWTAVGFLVLPANLDAEAIRGLLGPGLVGDVAVAVHRASDAVWMTWAAAVCLPAVAAAVGWRAARIQFLVIAAGSAAVEWLGAATGFPFGPYTYGETFGWRIGGVLPFTIPLAWFVVVTGSRTAARLALPGAGPAVIALAAGSLAVLTDVNLEHVAWHLRGYWTWFPESGPHEPGTWPPARNFVAWFVLAVAFAAACHRIEQRRPRSADTATLRAHADASTGEIGSSRLVVPVAVRPVVVLALMNALFLAARLFAPAPAP